MDFSMFENMRNSNDLRRNIERGMNQDNPSSVIRFPEDFRRNTKHDMGENNSSSVSRFPEETPLGMAYVPMQQWSSTFDDAEGFKIGTIFPELNLPFEPEEGCNG